MTDTSNTPTEEAIRAYGDDLIRRKLIDALTIVLDAHLPSSIPAAERLATRLHSHYALVSSDPAWGWVVMRLEATRLGRTNAMEVSLDRMYQEGVATGVFRDLDPVAGDSDQRRWANGIRISAPIAGGVQLVGLVLIATVLAVLYVLFGDRWWAPHPPMP